MILPISGQNHTIFLHSSFHVISVQRFFTEYFVMMQKKWQGIYAIYTDSNQNPTLLGHISGKKVL